MVFAKRPCANQGFDSVFAPVYSQAGTSASVTLNSSILTNATNTADQQLIQLWQKSSKAERQKFMGWLAEQAN